MALLIPRQIGALRLGGRIGEGGMALVHEAQDPFKPGVRVAVKLLRPEVHEDRALVRRFLREGEVLTHLRHPHLVEVQAFGRAGSWPYLVMELLPRGSVKACRGEPPARIIQRLLGPVEALEVAHQAGVVHRDLKPSNLLFAEDGRLKVTDFGVCLWEGNEGTRVTRSQMVVGTLGYMAPEQHGDPRRVDRRCDVYALGAILYEFTTGQAYAQVQLPPASARPGFPPRLARILMQALAPDPAKRLPSMEEVGAELSTWLESAEAAGWGEAPLPGARGPALDLPTRAGEGEEEDVEVRLGPYLDGLASGPVGVRRAAAEALLRALRPEDEGFLLGKLGEGPEGARFALCQALGRVGGAGALPVLLERLEDPFARAEAAEAASLSARREGLEAQVIGALRGEGGLGEPWRWAARARLGDEAWAEALLEAWERLAPPQPIQALEAAALAPAALRERIKERLRPRLASLGLRRMLDEM